MELNTHFLKVTNDSKVKDSEFFYTVDIIYYAVLQNCLIANVNSIIY